ELLHQLDIPEPAEVVVKASRIVIRVTLEGTKRLWRILAEDVIAADGVRRVVQQGFPARQSGCGLFDRLLTLFAALYLFSILGITCHRMLFHRLGEDQVVGQLTIDEDRT